MFVSFLMPYVDRGQGPIFRSLMFKQVAAFGAEHLTLIADAPYFENLSATPWGEQMDLLGLRFSCPQQAEFDATPRFVLASSIFGELEQRSRSMLDAYRILLTEDYPPLREALQQILRQVHGQGKIDAVLSWCNAPSLVRAAMELKIPVIHNELGPLRAPNYQGTIYFDFKGVNGQTSAEAEMHRFAWEGKRRPSFRPLPRPALRDLLCLVPEAPAKATRFRAGAALQVEDDSNLLAYGKGWTNFELIFAARKGGSATDVLVRQHPRGYAEYSAQLGVPDTSENAGAFIAQCDSVFSINSSVAFECLLEGKPVSILGDSPAAGLSRERGETMTAETYALCLNYLFVTYLVPAGLLYDREYYLWRLTQPSLWEIYGLHLALFAQARKVLPARMPILLDRPSAVGENPARTSQETLSNPARHEFVPDAVPAVGRKRPVILFVSHDASRTGAPIYLLNLIRWISSKTDYDFRILLRTGGPLEKQFSELGETVLASEVTDYRRLLDGVSLIYSNTCTNGQFLKALQVEPIPILTHVHELDYVIELFGRASFAATVAQTTQFVACSKAVAEGLQDRQGVSKDKIQVVYESIPLEGLWEKAGAVSREELRRHHGIDPDAFIVVACGGVDWRKGPDLFLQIAETTRRRLGRSCPVKFLWIGLLPEDDRRRILLRDLELLGLGGVVEFVGQQENPYPYLNLADAFCLCSREDPFPLVMLEAAALSKPVVCFEKAGGAPEFCQRGGGLSVGYLNVEAMSARLVEFASDAELRRQTGRAAERLVREEFDLDATAPQILQLIEKTARLSPVNLAAQREKISACCRDATRCVQAGDYAGAERLLAQALEGAPVDAGLLVARGNALFQLRDLEAARDQFARAVASAPGHAEAHGCLGMTLVQMGRLREGEAALHESLRLAPQQVPSLRLLAGLYLRDGRYAEGAKCCAELLRQLPADNEALVCQARCRHAMGHVVLAELLIEQVLENDPAHRQARQCLAAWKGEMSATVSGELDAAWIAS